MKPQFYASDEAFVTDARERYPTQIEYSGLDNQFTVLDWLRQNLGPDGMPSAHVIHARNSGRWTFYNRNGRRYYCFSHEDDAVYASLFINSIQPPH